MNPLIPSRVLKKSIVGSAMIESIMSIPLILGLLFFAIHLSLLTIAKNITQWACYQTARTLLAHSAHQSLAMNQARHILKQIPVKKGSPRFNITDSEQYVTVSIHQPVSALGRSYEIDETFSLYR